MPDYDPASPILVSSKDFADSNTSRYAMMGDPGSGAGMTHNHERDIACLDYSKQE